MNIMSIYLDGRQISTNVDNDNFDDQKIESKLVRLM